MRDLFGKAILDFQTNNDPQELMTETSISEADDMSVAYLFRSFSEMPLLEQRALELSKGKVLDIGCGAGSHSLYLQNEKHLEVVPIDISPRAIQACALRGVKNAVVQDFMTTEGKFDTILLLMNGTGICGTLDNMNAFLQKLKSLLNPNGQILIDSSDIIYMFDEDEDGGKWIPGDHYYGEIVFNISYKGEKEIPFNWLYVDFKILQHAAISNGLHAEILLDGTHYDYLARLSIL